MAVVTVMPEAIAQIAALPKVIYERVEASILRISGEPPLPELPPTDSRGNYPAREALRVVAARRLIRARRALGWSQIELARRACVRVETLSRLEHGKHSASAATMEKLRRALGAGEADMKSETSPEDRPSANKRKQNK